MNELLLRSAVELVDLVRDRIVSARELLAACRENVHERNAKLNAIVTFDWERAEAAATRADEVTAAGRPVGLLHGLPVTVKDCFETAGMRTTAGAAELLGHVPVRDAVVVERLRSAGAVLVGKTNLPAWAADWQCDSEPFGATVNPWGNGRTPGGSSGGSAVSVATGMSGLDVGSDLGGSVRIPAHFCGVYGLKPTYGLVPVRGHVPPAPGALAEIDIATPGPLVRSADDLDRVLDVLAGPDAAHSVAWRLALPSPRASSLRDYRVGIWFDDPSCAPDAATSAALAELADRVRRVGASVLDVTDRLPSLAEGLSVFHRLVHWMAALTMDARGLEGSSAEATGGDDWPTNVTRRAADHHLAREHRARLALQWAEVFTDVDVLMTPVFPCAAPPATAGGSGGRQVVIDGSSRSENDLFGWVQAIGAVHLPAAVAPLPRASGLPIGVQIVGPYLEDRTPIDVARRLTEVGVAFEAPPLARPLARTTISVPR